MEVDKMEQILKVMRENNVMGFEVGDFKVTFFAHERGGVAPSVDEHGNEIDGRQRLDDDLGLDYDEV